MIKCFTETYILVVFLPSVVNKGNLSFLAHQYISLQTSGRCEEDGSCESCLCHVINLFKLNIN